MYKTIARLLLRVGRILTFQIDKFLQPYSRHLNVFSCKVWVLYGVNIYHFIVWGTHYDIAVSLNTDRHLETGEVNPILDVSSSYKDVLEDSFLHADLWFSVCTCATIFYCCRSALKRKKRQRWKFSSTVEIKLCGGLAWFYVLFCATIMKADTL